jgi:hypothetical protein
VFKCGRQSVSMRRTREDRVKIPMKSVNCVRKLCSRFVPKFISGEMTANRLACCEYNFKLHDKYGDALLQNIVTEDKTHISLYVPESKRDSSEWWMTSEQALRMLRSGTFHGRATMRTVFFGIFVE